MYGAIATAVAVLVAFGLGVLCGLHGGRTRAGQRPPLTFYAGHQTGQSLRRRLFAGWRQ